MFSNFVSEKNQTSVYYFNARWYDPETGRFVSEDQVRDGPNWYAYVGNNPLKWVDPTGLKYDDPNDPQEMIDEINEEIEANRGNQPQNEPDPDDDDGGVENKPPWSTDDDWYWDAIPDYMQSDAILDEYIKDLEEAYAGILEIQQIIESLEGVKNQLEKELMITQALIVWKGVKGFALSSPVGWAEAAYEAEYLLDEINYYMREISTVESDIACIRSEMPHAQQQFDYFNAVVFDQKLRRVNYEY